MAQAVLARKQGDEFQARIFWLHAAALLDEDSPVRRVAFETGPRAFDDVLVEYAQQGAPQDHMGKPIFRDHLQCKWHVRPGEFGFPDFADPSFIGAQTNSFLQRAHEAQREHAPMGEGSRFRLLTNWRLKERDPLARLILSQTNALDLDAMFAGGGASLMGRLRTLWNGHLGIDNDELRVLARTLGVSMRLGSAEELRDRLNDKFAAVGMRRIPADEAGFGYDDIIAKLHAQGRKDFDRESFRAMVHDEKLLARREPPARIIGVRSFMHPIDSLEGRATINLNLVPSFEGRFLKDGADWNADIYPALKAFVIGEAQKSDRIRLVLDVHVSLAFAVGALLDVKSGKAIEIEQRTNGRRFWSRDDQSDDPRWPGALISEEVIGAGPDLAVAIGLTHDVAPMVRDYLRAVAGVGKLLVVTLATGPSGASVQGGAHAMKLAEAIVAAIRRESRRPMTHFFIAAPNGFTFFLGQHRQALGPSTVYEWDFEGKCSGTYSPGLVLD
jgi:hypothetical protein